MDSERTLLLVFSAPRYFANPAPFRELAAAFPRSLMLGCSSAGEILGDKILDGAVVVGVVQFEKAHLRQVTRTVAVAGDLAAECEQMARALDAPDLAGILVLCGGVGLNGSDVPRGFRKVFACRIPIAGGLAADGDRFERTWVLADAEPRAGVVSAVAIYGAAARIGHGSRGGWDIFGPERLVTRSCANVLYELDGKPALDLYRKYLGDRAEGLPASALLFPLSVRATRQDPPVVRTVLAVDERERSITFAGDIEQGSLALLMRANFDRLIRGAGDAGEAALIACDGPVCCIAISCVGRRLVLGQRTEEELEAVRELLPPETHQLGFYSYGEITPRGTGGCDLHNQTMTLTTLGEA
jgi:hypothetical protein